MLFSVFKTVMPQYPDIKIQLFELQASSEMCFVKSVTRILFVTSRCEQGRVHQRLTGNIQESHLHISVCKACAALLWSSLSCQHVQLATKTAKGEEWQDGFAFYPSLGRVTSPERKDTGTAPPDLALNYPQPQAGNRQPGEIFLSLSYLCAIVTSLINHYRRPPEEGNQSCGHFLFYLKFSIFMEQKQVMNDPYLQILHSD